MNKIIKWLLVALTGTLVFAGCQSSQAFQMKDITIDEVAKKMDDKESFALLVVREGCEFCEAMDKYIEKTKQEHPKMVLYRLDTTKMGLHREKEGDKTLVSDKEDGKKFLERFPYFLYTPAIYQIKDGKATGAGIGYDERNHTVSSWNVDSPIDWQQARPVDMWSYISEAAAPAAKN